MDLKRYGEQCGIDLIGVVEARTLDHLRDYLIERRENHMGTSFESDDIESRLNPKLSFEDAKSIIVIGLSYAHDYEYGEDEICRNSLSSHGIDYHIVLREKLNSLAHLISQEREFNYSIQVDTGPLLERELARLAGIGYFGKNCNIINPTLGSYIFLGLMLVDFQMEEYSIPLELECGNCKICSSACPTGALYDDYKVNASICLSYISQSKGEVAEEYRDKLEYVYGCDICQRVCPMNRGVPNNSHHEFAPMVTSVEIDELEGLSNREFKEKYGNYAFSWRGKKNIIRNCKIIKSVDET